MMDLNGTGLLDASGVIIPPSPPSEVSVPVTTPTEVTAGDSPIADAELTDHEMIVHIHDYLQMLHDAIENAKTNPQLAGMLGMVGL